MNSLASISEGIRNWIIEFLIWTVAKPIDFVVSAVCWLWVFTLTGIVPTIYVLNVIWLLVWPFYATWYEDQYGRNSLFTDPVQLALFLGSVALGCMFFLWQSGGLKGLFKLYFQFQHARSSNHENHDSAV